MLDALECVGILARMFSGKPNQRIAEVGSLLALAVSRIVARQSSGISDHAGETELDISLTQSGHRRKLENDLVE